MDDIRKAAERHHALFGSGPFFVGDKYSVAANLQGTEVEFTHSVAFGQWGEMQVELLQVHDGRPSILNMRHPYGSGRYGIHHVAIIADDLDSATRDLEMSGFPVFFRHDMTEVNLRTIMVDSWESQGHFLELYQKSPFINEFYDLIAGAAKDFTGKDLFRPLVL